MTESQESSFEFNTRQILAGSILIGVGGVIALAGVAMAGTALVGAFRRRVQQMDVPPSELARQNWSRVKAATAAGASVWRNGQQPASVEPQSS